MKIHTLALIALLAALAAAAPPTAAQQPEWAAREWPRRVLLRPVVRKGREEASWASHRAHLPVGADPLGRGIAVVAPDGRALPVRIVHSEPDGHHRVAFPLTGKDGLYALYYGNAEAPRPRRREPVPALRMSTMPVPEGLDSSQWDAVAEAVQAGSPYGVDFADRIFQGHNPFGPQADYITVYSGTFRVEKPGRYRFAVMNEHTCYLRIDGKPAGSLTGYQNVGRLRRPREGAPVQLGAGQHELLFVAFSYGRAMRHAVAWAPPGKEHFELMPASAFPAVAGMREARTEALAGPCADFQVQPKAYCESGGARMVGVRFSFSGSGVGQVRAWHWQFGDGLESAAPEPEHVYLRSGLYTVRLEVVGQDGRRVSVTKRLRVEPLWMDQDFRQPKLDAFWEATKDYAVKSLETDSLLALWRFWRSVEQHEAAARAVVVLSERHADLAREDRYEVAMAMADYYHHREFDVDRAEQWLRAALATTDAEDLERRWAVRFALCDHYYYYERDPAKARMEYEKLRIDYPQADPAQRRLALIRIGDTYRSQAKVDQARKRYREAEQDPRYQPSNPRAVVVGGTLHQVQAYMARQEGAEALKELEKLLWHYPTLRLDGQTTLLRCRAALQQGNWREARKHADAYIEFADDPNYLPGVHLAAARACQGLGRTKDAAAHYRKIVEKFPESPESTDAQQALEKLGQ